jgi:hypothetical protein
MNTNLTRRKFFQTAGIALVLLPIVGISRQAMANTNKALRAKLKYQNTPKDNMSCTACLEFVPGKSEKDLGGCKVIPGDDEISPDGYCSSWNSM